jgi:4-amino-4-deoxy-L-arabinose transferase-like glycosyltransferase
VAYAFLVVLNRGPVFQDNLRDRRDHPAMTDLPVAGVFPRADPAPGGADASSPAETAMAEATPRWVLPALLGVAGLAAFLYLWNVTVSGWANTYYAMAAQAASVDWAAFFFGSLDAGNFITLDKPPLSTWVMGLSVRIFGLSAASVLVPQALAGVATVLVVFAAVRRSFGPVAGIVAALVTALTPAAVLIFRYDNPDAILTLLLVVAAYAFVRSLEAGSWRWVLLAATLVGAGFLAKYLQAWMVLPAFAVTYLVAVPGGLGRRMGRLVAAGATVLATSLWWVVTVDAIPASARPYIGGSETNSALELVFGFNGLGRIFGGGGPGGIRGPGGVSGPGGSPFGGEPGLLRLFNEQFDGQIAWLLPFALIALGAGLWLTRRAARTDSWRAGYLLWGLWLLTHALVFSFMSGIVHPYYAVIIAPAIGALVGAGLVDLWAWRSRSVVGGAVLGAAVVVTGLLAAVLLARTPDFVPWLGPAVAVAGIVIGVLLALPARFVAPVPGRAAVAAAVLVALAAPASYALATMERALAVGDPQVGPATASGGFPGGLPGGRPGPGGAGGPPGGAVGSGLDVLGQAALDYLVANRGEATWLVAVPSANLAGPIQLQTGVPVMAMGGFSGGDPAPTLEQLQAYVRSGAVRFVLTVGGRGGFPGVGGSGGTAAVSSWVVDACSPVNLGPASTAAATLYDCVGAAD